MDGGGRNFPPQCGIGLINFQGKNRKKDIKKANSFLLNIKFDVLASFKIIK